MKEPIEAKDIRTLPDTGFRIRTTRSDDYITRLSLLRNRLRRSGAIASDAEHWLWPHVDESNGGYGRIKWGAGRIGVHRASYMVFVADVPDELVMDHLCRVHDCFNPWHLEPVTNAENVLRGDGFPAIHARQTHCGNGHPFTVENVYSWPSRPTLRQCKICHRAKIAMLKERKVAAEFGVTE